MTNIIAETPLLFHHKFNFKTGRKYNMIIFKLKVQLVTEISKAEVVLCSQGRVPQHLLLSLRLTSPLLVVSTVQAHHIISNIPKSLPKTPVYLHRL